MNSRQWAVTSLIAVALLVGLPAASDIVPVEGGRIAGAAENGVRVFKGIPFAAPPVGSLRWKAPQPVVPWTGVRQATEFGADCMQVPYPAGSPYASEARPVSEDCMFLNVWTTASAGSKQPVMFWIHGGAWTRGAGASPTYEGAALAKRGVVVVTTNYRLGVFGFFAHPELTAESPQHASGNYAILDHIAALKWVQKNIAAFGGDPEKVTIFGESAGSWSVNVTQATPLAKGLFRAAIGESGGQFARNATLAEAEKAGVALGTSLGAGSLAALRALPAEKLNSVQNFRTGVNVDSYVLPHDVRSTFATKQHNNVPVLVGSNANEWTTLSNRAQFPKTLDAYRKYVESQFGDYSVVDAAYPVKSEADIPDAMLALGRDRTFTLEMRTWARLVTAAGRKAFLYQFTHVPPSPRASEWGAYHASELGYVFGNLRGRGFMYSDVDRRLSDEMMQYWVNFATGSDPSGKGLPAWTPYDESNEAYMDLGDTLQMKAHLLKPQLDALERAQRQRTTSQQ